MWSDTNKWCVEFWNSTWFLASSKRHVRRRMNRTRSTGGNMYKDVENSGDGKPTIKVSVDRMGIETGYR
ncbi:hypothetical protein A2U01_0062165, partial [Trifolium medium]|nr:hypothetical protein [Trifolium medium]